MNTFDILERLVAKVVCKPGWDFDLVNEDDTHRRLVITVAGRDAYDKNNRLAVRHYFPVPMATYNEKTWRRWIFEMCRLVENHELGEWFVVDNERPFAPLHGPGENPYEVHEFRPEVDARTTQSGTIKPRPEAQ
jgi:hypothetical protein